MVAAVCDCRDSHAVAVRQIEGRERVGERMVLAAPAPTDFPGLDDHGVNVVVPGP
jgi:hypothetical protein